MENADVIFWYIVFGLSVNHFLGMATQCVVDIATSSIELTPKTEKWKDLTSGNEGGLTIGYLERLLFFGAFISGHFEIIGVWLAFKLTSKWEAWSNIASIPSEIEGMENIDYVIARRKWASHVLVSFQVGILTNILLSYLAVEAFRITYEMFTK